MARTRSIAGDLCKGGKVSVNGSRAKASYSVKIGDTVSVTINRRSKIYVVQGFADRRGSAAAAAPLFKDVTPPTTAEEQAKTVPVARREQGSGRPTKKDRRALEKLKS
jgi:ribosome-associated heat shock protein Hsp15